MDIRNKLIAILLAALIILIISGIVTYKVTGREKTYQEQIKYLAKNLINDML